MRHPLFSVLAAALSLLPASAALGRESALSQLTALAPAGAPPAKGAVDAGLDALAAQLRVRLEQERESRPLFTVTQLAAQGKTKSYLVVRDGQLEKPYLFSSTLERGTGENGVFSTMMDATFLCSFRRSGDRLLFVRRQTGYRAEPGTPESRAIERSVADEVLAVAPVVSSDAAMGYAVVSADELFLDDLTRVKAMLSDRFEGRAVALRKGDGAVERLAAFPRNVEVQAQLVYSVTGGAAPDSLLALTMRYSITQLPDNPGFEPRPADRRVGHFTTDFRDLGKPELRGRQDPLEHWVNRWDLRKKEPDAPVSDVERPVVFWLDDAIPERFRPAVKAGILAWNEAFEAAGLRGALQVKEVDKDLTPEQRASFDPADVSYNMIRWFVGDGAAFAIGPSRVNPLTGEIFHASISIGDLITRYVDELDLAGEPAPSARTRGPRDDSTLLAEKRREAASALALLQGRGELPPEELARFQDEFVTELLAHEVGHTLGLRHNFKGSSAGAGEGLHSSTVMDYLPANVAAPGAPQGAYFQTRVGPYDAWAIEYAYKTLSGTKAERAAALEAIAAKGEADPRLAYATDEEVNGIDPAAQTFDLGIDPLAFARARTALARGLFKRLESQAPDQDPVRLREKFSTGLGAYMSAARAVLPVIGGVRTRRGAGVQFEPVPAAEQRKALAFLEKEVFAPAALSLSPELLGRLGNEQLGYPIDNEPYPMSRLVLSLQGRALRHLYSPRTLRRLADSELYARDPGGRFTPGEMMDRVRRAVWTEVSGQAPAPVGLFRRNLQREHMAVLAATLEGSVPDAQAAARRDVARVARDIRRALPALRDEASKLHLQEMLRQAEELLEPAPRRTR